MDYAKEEAARWRQEIERMTRSIAMLESGEIAISINFEDVSKQHIADLQRMIAELKKALPILDGAGDT